MPCGVDKWNNRSHSPDQLDCTPCALFSSTDDNERAQSADECVCDAGHFNTATSLLYGAEPTCAPCFVGINCPNKNTTRINLPLTLGYWRISATSLDVRRCPDAAANCSRTGDAICEHSSSGCRGGADPSDSCAAGLTGPFCRLCINQSSTPRILYEPASTEHVARCSMCGHLVGHVLAFYAAVLCGVLLLVSLLLVIMRCQTERVRGTWVRLVHDTVPETKLKILVGFYAIVSKLPDVYESSVTAEVRQVMSYVSVIISFGFEGITPVLTCVGLHGFVQRLRFWMLTPPVLVGIIFLGSLSTLAWKAGSSVNHAIAEVALPLTLRLLFVLFPSISNVAFEAFSCYEFEGGSSYLIADVSIECHSEEYRSQVRPLAWAAIAIYAFGLVALNAVLLFCARTAILSRQPTRLSLAIQFLHKEYEPWAFWWELVEARARRSNVPQPLATTVCRQPLCSAAVDCSGLLLTLALGSSHARQMLRRLMLVGIFVLYERGSVMQLVFAAVFCAVYLLLQMSCMPYDRLSEDFLANGASFALLIIFLGCIVFKLGALTELPDVQAVISTEQGRDFAVPSLTLSVILFGCVFGAIVVSFVVLVVQLAMESARVRTEAAAHLPTCKWQLADGQHYVAFLSHYKVEAGAQARYLKDSLDRMLGCPAYLDSSTLADLRKLFKDGVHTSEVLVLLLSHDLLTRPWCDRAAQEAEQPLHSSHTADVCCCGSIQVPSRDQMRDGFTKAHRVAATHWAGPAL